jgi:hypothetical protein
MSPLAFDLVPWLGGLCALLVAVLALVVVAPWSRGRDDAALDPEVEARLLLGEDPEEIQRDLERRSHTPPVSELPVSELPIDE